jgi:DDE superfamily endonuclease
VAEAAHLAGESGSGLRRNKGAIVGLSTLHTAPPPADADADADSTVIGLDELGPSAARRYPGPRRWSDETHRPHLRPAYAPNAPNAPNARYAQR